MATTPTLVRVQQTMVRTNLLPLLGHGVFGCVEAYALDPSSLRVRAEVLSAQVDLDAGVIGHYPGVGVVTHDFHWQNVIGPLDRRTDPTPRERAFDTPRWLEYGPDEYGRHLIDYREATGRDVAGSIQVNIITGTAAEAADWVEYMNGEASTPLGALRAANGHAAPYRVAMWEMGNEPHFTAADIGALSAAQYAARVREFALAMKERDPSITVLAYVNPFPLGDPTRIGTDAEEPVDADDALGRTWSQIVIAEAGDVLDGVYFHWYGAWNDNRHSALEIVSSPITGLHRLLDRALSDIHHFAPSADSARRLTKAIHIPEWNSFGGWVQPVASGTGLQGALAASRTLHCMFGRPEVASAQHFMLTAPHPEPAIADAAYDLHGAPLFDIRDGYATLFLDVETGAVLRTTLYEAFALWNRARLGRVVASTVVNPPLLENRVPALDVTTMADDTTVSIVCTNVGYAPQPVTIDLGSIAVTSGTKLTLTGYHRFARNDWARPREVSVVESAFPATGTQTEVVAPPLSITALILPKATLSGQG